MNLPLAPHTTPREDTGQGGARCETVVTTSSQAPVPALTRAVLSGQRFIALTGEPGVSRSGIVDAFAIALAAADIAIIRVRNGAPGPLGVSRLVALLAGSSFASSGNGVEDDLRRLVRVLTAPIYRGKRLVLLIEDAEALDRPALAMLRPLPDLPREASPFAQVALVGRSGHWTLLADPAPSAPGKSDVTSPAPGAAKPADERVVSEPPLQAFSAEQDKRQKLAGVVARLASPHLRRRFPALAVASGFVAVVLLGYHTFYRGLPFRPAALPSPASSAPAVTAEDPPPSPPPAAQPPASAALATPNVGAPSPAPSPSPEKLREDFDAFLLSQGGDVARLSEADRRELFKQYLSRRQTH